VQAADTRLPVPDQLATCSSMAAEYVNVQLHAASRAEIAKLAQPISLPELCLSAFQAVDIPIGREGVYAGSPFPASKTLCLA